MKKSFTRMLSAVMALIALAAASSPPAAAMGTGTAYYVSAAEGDDSNPGTQDAPWQSLAKRSTTVFEPGDTIYLKRGERNE
jgi:ABC-type transport system substrate-binding protein